MTRLLYAARGTNQTASDLYTVDPATAAMAPVGPIGFALTGLAYDRPGGVMYGATSTNSSANPKSLITVNLVTGAGTLIGAFGGASARVFSDLACDSAGNLYGWLTNGTGPLGLYSINKATGVATAIGGDTVGSLGGGLGFDSGDVLWYANQDTGAGGSLYTIDPVTGAGTLAAAMTGYAAPSATGVFAALSFGPADVLYGADNNRNALPPNVDLVTVTAPGAVGALVATFSVTGVDAIAWWSPPTVLLVATASGVVPGTYTDRRDLPVTGSAGRKRFSAAGDQQAVTVRLTQVGPSAQTNVFSVSLEVRPYDTDSET